MKIQLVFLASLILGWGVATAQESDLALKQNFESRHGQLSAAVDSASRIEQLDSLAQRIAWLEREFAGDSTFLDKALYPATFAGKIHDLRGQSAIARERVSLIGTQGARIMVLETELAFVNRRVDSLDAQRTKLLAELHTAQQNVTQLRDVVRRLTSTLQAKDRLIFSLIDSIFMPYDRNLNQLSEVQREALTSKLEKSNVMSRVYDIAMDNVSFLGLTQLQPKDYAALVEEYQQFRNRWSGLRERIKSADVSVETRQPAGAKGAGGDVKGKTGSSSGGSVTIITTGGGGKVDTALAVWEKKLQTAFWAGLQKEITSKGVIVKPFNDAQSFSAAVRAYIDSAKATGADASTFVNDVWIGRIDKEWRDALMKESMLGKTEYSALDKAVSELHKEKLDWRILFWIGNIILIVLIGWWVLSRKPKVQPANDTQQQPPQKSP